MTNLTKQTFSGLIWTFGERICAQTVSMVVSIILARLLMPEDYGLIALVSIFISLCGVFVSSGFGTALIQKKDADEIDFSSVFYASFFIAIVLYWVLFFCAPLIAKFYNNTALIPVLRVLSLSLPISAINSVQHAKISRRMAFKKFFWATLFGTIVSAVVGIWMAYTGYGVWALVAQSLINTCIDTVVLAIVDHWYPRLKFSFQRLKGLFSYGWKLLISGLLNTGYGELRSLVIGKKYTTSDLAFYNKGQSFPNLVVSNASSALQSTLFPALSKKQDNRAKVKEITRRAIKTSCYIILPGMVGLAVIARAFVEVVLTAKWLPAVSYMQIMCASLALMPIHTANLQAIKALGRSDLFLKLEIAKKVVGITLLIISMWFGVLWIALTALLAGFLSSIINAFPNKKLLGYGYWEQIKDILPALLLSLFMGGIVYCISFIPMPAIATLVVQIVVGIAVYVIASIVLRIESFYFIINTIKSFFHKEKAEDAAEVSGAAADVAEPMAEFPEEAAGEELSKTEHQAIPDEHHDNEEGP